MRTPPPVLTCSLLLCLVACGDTKPDENRGDLGIADAATTDLFEADQACPELSAFDAASGTCKVRPILDIIQCPLYAPDCTLQFFRVSVDPGESTTESVSLLNTGELPLHVASATISGGGPFTIAPVLPVTLPPQALVALKVTFAPTQSGFFSGVLTVESDAVLTIPKHVPVLAATTGARCASGDQCLIGETCKASTCEPCPMITPPPCANGTLVLGGKPGECQQPTCMCTAPAVYVAGMGCSS